MKNNNMGTGIIIAIIIIILFALLGSCSSNNDYSNTLTEGRKKYYSGEKMTEQEYKAVKRYNNWKDKQGSKSYSDWNN